jgi:hypothetical protein
MHADAAALPGADTDAAAPAGDAERPTFCERAVADAVRSAFCEGPPPVIGSLQDLQELLDIPVDPRVIDPDRPPSIDGFALPRAVILLGHSTALAGHLVSPINPRALVIGDRTIMAYQRGVQRIELATLANGEGTFNFYLVDFEQACNERAGGCAPGDLFTPRIESGWTRLHVRDDEDLKNTPQDCRQCHQRGRDSGILLMRELRAPWTHFFEPSSEQERVQPQPGVRGSDLLRDYLQAKGDEPYGLIPSDIIAGSSGFLLEAVVHKPQPLVFDAPTIEGERHPYGSDGERVGEPQPSPTWDAAYAAFKRGEQLALPYIDARPTDPDKQARLTEAYARYRAGELDAEELPDLADIFPDDPRLRAQIGLQTEPDASPGEALIQACGACHNDVLDQSISRARFNIDLTRLDRDQVDRAIERIELPATAPGAMPPPEARQLDPAARERLLDYLRADERSTEFDAQLERAAALGMLGTEP